MITTEECIKAITKKYYESENPNYDLLNKELWVEIPNEDVNSEIERFFKNETADTSVRIILDDDKIIFISEHFYPQQPRRSAMIELDNLETTKFSGLSSGSLQIGERTRELPSQAVKVTNIYSYLREKLQDEAEGEISDLHYEALGPDYIIGWPKNRIPEDCDPEEATDLADDDQDMENFGWVSLSHDRLVVSCGGDWQEPMVIEIRIVDDYLTVVNTVPNAFHEGINDEDLNVLLFG